MRATRRRVNGEDASTKKPKGKQPPRNGMRGDIRDPERTQQWFIDKAGSRCLDRDAHRVARPVIRGRSPYDGRCSNPGRSTAGNVRSLAEALEPAVRTAEPRVTGVSHGIRDVSAVDTANRWAEVSAVSRACEASRLEPIVGVATAARGPVSATSPVVVERRRLVGTGDRSMAAYAT